VAGLARLARLRAVPWLLLFEVARGVHSHVMDSLSPAERRHVMQILRKSKGNPGNVTPREREELRRLAGKLDFKRLGRDLAPRVIAGQRRRRRGR
jgi:DNA primase catalytic subunit